ncbi:hypothetical protein B0I33_11511 [Prauserella shujinwangii]|uniref:Uncharacterized protein n=1 Tax=Prauserella shujinwangii TaxID=1453103 RepID=A0A2T0LKL5_9PSEU|nr:hypothetical protein [Prauserella shujinwangii]PRX43393.1 hypothetical protein B0I33_11511 [Prauserella shujinwangii]
MGGESRRKALRGYLDRKIRIRLRIFLRTVAGRVDAVGAVILVAYLVFAVFRTRIVGLRVHGPAGGATSVAVLAGVMAGQVLGIRYGLRRLYREVTGT